jgi:hypothetical protein
MPSSTGTYNEFRITISVDQIEAKYGPPEALEQDTALVRPWSVDELSLETALLFESWLNVWNRIEGIKDHPQARDLQVDRGSPLEPDLRQRRYEQ